MHKSMFHFIKQLLFSSENKAEDEIEEKKTSATKKSPCSLELEMNDDGTINIICSWPEFNENNKKLLHYLSNYYALMIDAVNSGLLEQEIINTLRNYASDNTMDILFAQNVYYKIIELNFLRKEQEKFSTPLVKPSQVFHKSS